MRYALIAFVLLLLGVGAWVRLAPIDPAEWHVDPLTTPSPSSPNYARIGPGVLEGPDLPSLAAAAHRVMMAMPRTRLIAGSVQAGWMTYQTRSLFWGFPDYTSIRILAGQGGRATLVALARARFGYSDGGVNSDRLETLYARLEHAFP